MNNYKCLNDYNCNVLYAYDFINPKDIAILKTDEVVVSQVSNSQSQVVTDIGNTYNYVLGGVISLVIIICLAAFLNKIFTK